MNKFLFSLFIAGVPGAVPFVVTADDYPAAVAAVSKLPLNAVGGWPGFYFVKAL